MQLSLSFTLEELLRSPTATRLGYTEQFTPPQSVIDNLKTLCEKVLQPLRNKISLSLNISSGYRCLRDNTAIGSASTSQHTKGQAADIELLISGVNNNFRLAQEVLRNKIIFDQMILEFGTFDKPAWIHLSYDSTKAIQRGQILRAETVNDKTVYTNIETDKIWH